MGESREQGDPNHHFVFFFFFVQFVVLVLIFVLLLLLFLVIVLLLVVVNLLPGRADPRRYSAGNCRGGPDCSCIVVAGAKQSVTDLEPIQKSLIEVCI